MLTLLSDSIQCGLTQTSISPTNTCTVLQEQTVTLQASVPGSTSKVQPVLFKARVKPCAAPCTVQLFTDAACREAMPMKRSAGRVCHVFKQPAGERVRGSCHLVPLLYSRHACWAWTSWAASFCAL